MQRILTLFALPVQRILTLVQRFLSIGAPPILAHGDHYSSRSNHHAHDFQDIHAGQAAARTGRHRRIRRDASHTSAWQR